jgi:hypothetical protein
MNRVFCVVIGVCALTAFASRGAAEPILLTGLGTTFVPGKTFTFDVKLPALSGLGSYNVDVVLESPTGIAGTDFFFDVAATIPSLTAYVFLSSANYFDAANVDSPARHRLTLTDFDLAGSDVEVGMNDMVAHVAVTTSPTFLGPLTVGIHADGLILDTPNIAPTPVEQFAMIQFETQNVPSLTLVPVPEPTSIMHVAWVLALLLRRAGIRRHPRCGPD